LKRKGYLRDAAERGRGVFCGFKGKSWKLDSRRLSNGHGRLVEVATQSGHSTKTKGEVGFIQEKKRQADRVSAVRAQTKKRVMKSIIKASPETLEKRPKVDT